MTRVASFMPKSAPGDIFWKKASLSFLIFVGDERLRLDER